MTNNYQCSSCSTILSADPDLTSSTQCSTCTTIIALEPPGSSNTSIFLDYQCPGCGASNTADISSPVEMFCNSCMTSIKLSRAQPQAAATPATENPLPQLGAASKQPLPEPADENQLPQLGAAANTTTPDSASENKLPELGAAAKTTPPDSAISGELTGPKKSDAPALKPESGFEESEYRGSESKKSETGVSEEEEFNPVPENEREKPKPAWLIFLSQPRILITIFGIAPVMITVVIGAVLTLIRSGTGIANGSGNVVMQGGQIVLCLVALWAMYNLGMTFYYADRDLVTDMGHLIMIIGACWGMFSIVTTFPSNFLAIMIHIFYGYVSIVTIILAAWLMAPYKGIGTPR